MEARGEYGGSRVDRNAMQMTKRKLSGRLMCQEQFCPVFFSVFLDPLTSGLTEKGRPQGLGFLLKLGNCFAMEIDDFPVEKLRGT